MNTLIYQLTQGFKRMYLSYLLTRQTLRILLNEKITGFIHLQPKQHWDLVLDTVCKHKLLYVALLIMFMDGLYLGNDFRLSFLIFLLFLLLLLFSLFCCCWVFYFAIVLCFIIFVLILCGFVRYCFSLVTRDSFHLCSWHMESISCYFQCLQFQY